MKFKCIVKYSLNSFINRILYFLLVETTAMLPRSCRGRRGKCSISHAKRDKQIHLEISTSVVKAKKTHTMWHQRVPRQSLLSNFLQPVHAASTATAGSAAEGKVWDPEEPGALLFHLCRCDGIQGRKTHTQNSESYEVQTHDPSNPCGGRIMSASCWTPSTPARFSSTS